MGRSAALIALSLVVTACGTVAPSVSSGRPASATVSASPAPSPSPTPPAARLGAFAPMPRDPVSADIAEALQAVLDEAVDPVHAPGIAAAVIDVSQGTWVGAAGTADGEATLEPAAQFGIGSVTKTVIAAQVLRLVEDGRVDLDERMDAYLDAEQVPTNGATVRQILGMRSGIREPTVDIATWCQDLAATPDRDEQLAALSNDPLFEPGRRFRYTNVNYDIAGLLIEQVTGRSIAKVLRADVLASPELDRLVYQDEERPTPPLAAPFVAVPEVSPLPDPPGFLEAGQGYLPARCIASSGGPAGGMAADAGTLATWGYLLYGGSILAGESLAAMTDFVDGYGLGTADYAPTFGVPAVGHGGNVPGYGAELVAFSEEGLVVAVLINTNRETRDITLIAARLRAALSSGRAGP